MASDPHFPRLLKGAGRMDEPHDQGLTLQGASPLPSAGAGPPRARKRVKA
jgi:hypothetical protein